MVITKKHYLLTGLIGALLIPYATKTAALEEDDEATLQRILALSVQEYAVHQQRLQAAQAAEDLSDSESEEEERKEDNAVDPLDESSDEETRPETGYSKKYNIYNQTADMKRIQEQTVTLLREHLRTARAMPRFTAQDDALMKERIENLAIAPTSYFMNLELLTQAATDLQKLFKKKVREIKTRPEKTRLLEDAINHAQDTIGKTRTMEHFPPSTIRTLETVSDGLINTSVNNFPTRKALRQLLGRQTSLINQTFDSGKAAANAAQRAQFAADMTGMGGYY